MKIHKNSNFFGVMCFTLFFATICTILYAAEHSGICVPAKEVLVESGVGCSKDDEGVCQGSITFTPTVVHGYCDTNEAGLCYDATAVLSIGAAQTVNCSLVLTHCIVPVTPPSGPLYPVTVPTCN